MFEPLEERVKTLFSNNIECIINTCDELSAEIAQASLIVAEQLLNGAKLLACGNGGAANDAQYFVSQLINRFERERPSLPAICLSSDAGTITAIAIEHSFNEIYAKQVRALGNAGDILMVISNNGNSANIIQAVQAAHEKGLYVIALSGNDGGDMASLLTANDIELRIQTDSNSRIKEAHLVLLHCLCDLIDVNLFGSA